MNIESIYYKSAKCGSFEGPLCTVELSAPHIRPGEYLEHLHIILVVDVSSSMYYTLSQVKSTLLAFRDIILGFVSTPTANPKEKDKIFREVCDLDIFTFSDECNHIWSSKASNGVSYSQTITGMTADSCTNIGDALCMSYKSAELTSNKLNWIILLTDGNPTVGNYLRVEDFSYFVTTIPENTRLITVGYGDNYNSEILRMLGVYSHIGSDSVIPTFMGSVCHEIMTTSYFNVQFSGGNREVVIGLAEIGPLFNERKYILGYTEYVPETSPAQVKYTKMTKSGLIRECANIIPMNARFAKLPTYVKSAYYNTESLNIINNLHSLRYKDMEVITAEIEMIRNLLRDTWTEPESNAGKQIIESAILGVLDAIERDMDIANQSFSDIVSMGTQFSYTNISQMTPESISLSRLSSTIASTYSQ